MNIENIESSNYQSYDNINSGITKQDFWDGRLFRDCDGKIYSFYSAEDWKELCDESGEKVADVLKITKAYFVFNIKMLGHDIKRKVYFSDLTLV